MNIAVCDDERLYSESIKSAIIDWSNKNMLQSVVRVQCFHSSEDLLEVLQKNVLYDVLFLDIEIPGELNGIDLAKTIRKWNTQIIIVFITNYSEYVYDGYVVDALRYIRKPFSFDQVAECLNIAHYRIELSREKTLLMQNNHERFVLPYRDIIMIEVLNHSIYIYTTNRKEALCFRQKISDVATKLPEKLFAQCHRSYVVNLMYVRRFSRTLLLLSNGREIALSKTYFKEFTRKFEIYYQGEDNGRLDCI